MKQHKATSHLPILFHSGVDEDTLRTLVAASGADGYVRKQKDLKHLVDVGSEYLAGGGARSSMAMAVEMAAETVGRLMVVDDSDVVRDVLGTKLQDRGYAVTKAASGAEALRLLETTPIDVVLTDIVMPEMDGLELIERIRSRSPRVSVLVLSSQPRFEVVAEAVNRGAVDYVRKDDVGHIWKALERALAQTNLARVRGEILEELGTGKAHAGGAEAAVDRLRTVIDDIERAQRQAMASTVAASVAHLLDRPVAALQGNLGRIETLLANLQFGDGTSAQITELLELARESLASVDQLRTTSRELGRLRGVGR